MTKPDVEPSLRIFLSYGHDHFAAEALRIKADLEARGHAVWFDLERLREGRDWEAYIEEGLRACDKVLLLMTPHSVRRRDPRDPTSRDGFCLNELAKAIELNRPIVPVLLADLDGGPPVSICRLQHLDLRDSVPIAERESRYVARFARLLRAIEEDDLDFGGGQARLQRSLRPLDFRVEMSRHITRFTGRKWLLAELDRWLQDRPRSRVFWITGPPGIGKTALATHLCHYNKAVVAHHLCVHGDDDKADPRRAILSIAYQMAEGLPAYARRLQDLSLEDEVTKNAQTLFDRLVVQPLRDIPPPEEPRLVVIDAIDEASRGGRNEIAALIRDAWANTPAWLRLVITSRAEPEIVTSLAGLDPHRLDAEREENLRDLEEFVRAELARHGLEAGVDSVRAIVDRSDGVFLYAVVVIEEIAQGHLSLQRLDDFPVGLSGHYLASFARRFSDMAAYRSLARPILDCICAARGPLPLLLLVRAAGVRQQELRLRLAELGSLFPIAQRRVAGREAESVAAFHRSLREWLTGVDARTGHPTADIFAADPENGEELLATACRKEYEESPGACSSYSLSWLPAHLCGAERGDEAQAMLLDLEFMDAKLGALGPQALIDDFDIVLHEPRRTQDALGNETLRILQGALRLSAHALLVDPSQLRAQLLGRLAGRGEPGFEVLCAKASEWKTRSWLRPLRAHLARPGGPLLRILQGHADGISTVAISPDGTRIVSGSSDGTLRVWDLETGSPRATLDDESGEVLSVAVTARGRRAVSSSRDGNLRLWDLESGDRLATFGDRSGPVLSVAVTPDGRRAACGSDDGAVRVWDLETRERLAMLAGHTGPVHCVAVTPDGRRIVSGSEDGTLRLWDLETDTPLAARLVHASPVLSVAVTADGRRVVSGSGDGALTVWDLETGVRLATLEGPRDSVLAVALTPDARRAISGSRDRMLWVWDLETRAPPVPLEGHSSWICSVAVTPDGRRAISGSLDRTLGVWDLEANASGGAAEGHFSSVSSVVVTTDGRRVVSGSFDRTVRVWELDSGALQKTLRTPSGPVVFVAVTTDGRRLVSASEDGSFRIWDLRTGARLASLEGQAPISSAAVTADGRRGISGSWDRTLRVWDLDTKVCLAKLEGHRGAVSSVAMTPDGSLAVSGSKDCTVRVWNVGTRALLATLEGHAAEVTSLAVTPDGSRALSGSRDRTLRLWDLRGGHSSTLEGHLAVVSAVAFSPDGGRAVSGSWDRTLRVWDLQTRETLTAFVGDAEVASLALAPDGRTIVVGDALGRIDVYALEEP